VFLLPHFDGGFDKGWVEVAQDMVVLCRLQQFIHAAAFRLRFHELDYNIDNHGSALQG